MGKRVVKDLTYDASLEEVAAMLTDRAFRELVLERSEAERGLEPVRPTVGALTASWDVCPAGCCANQRGGRPALCGRD